jgi:hypothetical protein
MFHSRPTAFMKLGLSCFLGLAIIGIPRSVCPKAYTQLSNNWLAAVDSALSKNKSSFAVLPISQLLAADGWLAKLRAQGYSIQEPK